MRILMRPPGGDANLEQRRADAALDHGEPTERRAAIGAGGVDGAQPRMRHRTDRLTHLEPIPDRHAVDQRPIVLLHRVSPPGQRQGRRGVRRARKQHHARREAAEPVQRTDIADTVRGTTWSSVCSRKPPAGIVGSPLGLDTATTSSSSCSTSKPHGTSGSCHGGRCQTITSPVRGGRSAPAAASRQLDFTARDPRRPRHRSTNGDSAPPGAPAPSAAAACVPTCAR